MHDLNLRAHWMTWPLGKRWYKTMKAYWFDGVRDREIEVTISPQGRSVRVYVDGKEWTA